MSKQILPHELAEIVTGLLVNPVLMGELDTPERHQAFMFDIGRVVADHCGGEVNWINPADNDNQYLADEGSSPSMSVSLNESLPSLHQNVWAAFDPDGWEGESREGLATGKSMTHMELAGLRRTLQAMLSNTALGLGEDQRLNFKMVDWRVREREAVVAGDEHPYHVTAYIGNQCYFEFLDHHDEPVFGLTMEINNGVPALHIDMDGGDAMLHIHKAHNGLVLTPDNHHICFHSAPVDRYGYESRNALIVLND